MDEQNGQVLNAGPHRHSLFDHFKERPAVWIGVLISAAVLFVAYLAYRRQAASAAATTGSTSATGSTGTPQWDTASVGAGGNGSGWSELSQELAATLKYLQSPATPNSPTPAPSGGTSSSGSSSSGSSSSPAQPTPAPAPAPSQSANSWYTVVSGDTLSGIAPSRFNESWQTLYADNKDTIDSTAHQHGFWSQEYNWIFPDEKLHQ